MIIAIDGPSGSGKSTLGRMLAGALKLLYIDTGSMYRAVALATIEAGIDPNERDAVTALAERIEIDYSRNLTAERRRASTASSRRASPWSLRGASTRTLSSGAGSSGCAGT